MPRGVAALTGLLVAIVLGTGAAQAAVVLNEVNCEATDWVEVVNTGADPVDLSGWLLTDDPLGGTRADHRMTFAAGTTIAAQGALVVEKGPSGFPFGVKCGEDTIRLADGAGAAVDAVVVPELEHPADTWGRYPNGTGDWRATAATRDAPNVPATSGGDPPDDAAAWLFEPGHVAEIDLGLSDAARAALGADPDEYVAGTFSLTTAGGTYGPLAVGVRLKGGAGSFRPLSGKAAFKISFNHVVPCGRFLGLRRMTLNNMVQDASMVHEILAYELFRAAGVPAPRTGNAFVRVNGEPYGVYLDVETPDAVSLPRWFPTTGHLYEGTYQLDVDEETVDAFEVDEGGEDERGDLAALGAAADAGISSPAMAAVADLGELTRMWAVEHYIGHWDGYSGTSGPNNYFLHSDAAGRFSMLPWGTDQTWVERTAFDTGGGRLFRACMEAVACRARYRAALGLVRDRLAGLGLEGRVDAVAAALAPWQQLDPRREHTTSAMADAVAGVRAFLAERPGDLERWLASEAPPDPPAPAPAAIGGARAPASGVAAVIARAAGTRASSLRVGPARASATALTTTVRVPGAGLLTQRATVRVGTGTVALCSARARTTGAATVTLRCRLGAGARRLRAAGALRVAVTTRFVPAVGAASSVSRALALPRAAAPRR